jgi:hypothetical protein
MPDACVDPEEASVTERFDEGGVRWVKVYVGGGVHFVNWLAQYTEIYGDENVEAEEIAALESSCYGQSGEKLFRIWVRENSAKTRNPQDV